MTETPENPTPVPPSPVRADSVTVREAGMDTRRAALARLGLAALAVYSAPVVTRLDQAKAAVPSHHCPPSSPCGGAQPRR